MRSIQKPVDTHQIAAGIHEKEIDVLRELNNMSELVGILPIPLDYDNGGIYYYLIWE